VSAPALVLAGHSLRRMRAMVAGMAIVLGAFQFLLTQVAAYLLRSGGFSLMPSLVPDFLQQMAGPSMFAIMSFNGVIGFGYFHPIVIAAHLGLAIAIGTEPAAEVETRFADLTLARPIARHQTITRTIVVLLAVEAIVATAMVASTITGLTCCTPATAPRPPARTIAALAVSLMAVALCWGGIAAAIAAAARRRATASGVAAVTALVAYLLDYLGRIWDPARRLSTLAPFHYFEPTALVSGAPLNVRDLIVLLACAAAGFAVAYAVFARRDL
jgi:beta-exotoxin I transport system permease protein